MKRLILGFGIFCCFASHADDVQISVTPQSPFVITGTFTNPISGATIPGPWFQFQVLVTNNSNQPVTIIDLQLVVSSLTNTVTTTLSPSNSNFTMDCGGGTSVPVTYASFGTIPAGTSASLSLTPANPSTFPAPCSPNNAVFNPAILYAGGNPSSTDTSEDNTYSVNLTVEGWYGTLRSPTNQFQQEVDFQTQ